MIKTLIWALVFLQLFVLLAIAVSYHPQGIWIDQTVLYSLHGTSNPILDKFALFSTDLGIYGATVPGILLISLLLTYRKQWHYLLYVTITALGSIALSYSRFDIQVVQQNPLFIGISAYLAVPG